MKTEMEGMRFDERMCLIDDMEVMLTEIQGMGCDEHRCLIKDMEAMLGRAKQPILEPNCCIYKVPQKMRERNPVAYTPQVVSIGPLHHGDTRFEPMEELKLGYAKMYLERPDMKLEDCIRKLKDKEEYIRGCYEDTISQHSDDFIKIILIDGCFIIEYFLRYHEYSQWNESDPVISKPCRMHDIDLDLILLENQLPFFVLEDLFTPVTCTGGRQFSSFLEVIFDYFVENYGTINKSVNDEFTFDYFCESHLRIEDGECEEAKVQHFIDLLRFFFLPSRELRPTREVGSVSLKYSASQLMEAGLKLKVSQKTQNKRLVELQFREGVLTMPQLFIDYDTETLLRNMAAFEQCHYPDEPLIAQYVVLLDFLINECKDVDLLVEKGVLVHLLGESNKVVAIFNDICMGTVSGHPYFDELSEDLNRFYENPLHKYKAIFIREYLSTPWKIASFVAAVVLLLLTLIQTICSLISL